MPRKKAEPTTTAAPRVARGPITEQLSDLLRALMNTLGTAYAEYNTPAAVADHLEQAKVAVLAARAAAHGGQA